ncbi:glutathione hydrolase 7 isoform X2 [Kryptolebias marmoratus]|uniref:glutathione hydrolase 7 isoform X2 n=1 Tax=Kryptolebias marmoratus TaxID=37003 RepID=UPI000D530F05|nr:glutathione hydrolase 7 isoform X2 [Kryptolebias marmoratus]
MNVSSGTKLKQEFSSNYKSFDGPSELNDDCPTNGFTCDSNKNSEAFQLNELTSGSSDLLDQSSSKLKETDEDRCGRDHPVHVYAFSIILAVGVTIALVLENHLDATLVSIKGVVSDHELCTVLSEKVLRDGGSSVDAAIAGTLCLGVVHPHVSGVGGGGVMLIHKIRQNETRVINFQGSAPNGLREEMLQNASEIKAGLLVGVPGMLMGLHHAHSLYGRFSWENVVSRAAAVAREGFNVSQSLAAAISQVEGEQLVGRFRDLFIPNGQPLSPGSYLRMPGVAEVLQAGLFSFYHGNVSQELEDEVRANGGVLSSEDLRNYSAEVQQPLEGLYNALIAALNLLESLHLGENNVTENKTYHWINEALTTALSMAHGLGDPEYSSSVSELLSVMISKNHTEVLRQKMDFQSSDYNSTVYSPLTELLTSQIVVMGPDDLVVSVASSLNRPFGSRIVTRSGVILNSLVVDFFWPNQSRGQPLTNKKNRVEPGKRPLSFLMPSMIVPAWSRCGTYMALSSSGGPNRLSEITQMLDSVLFHHKQRNDSLSWRGR